MRDRTAWRSSLMKQLRPVWDQEKTGLDAGTLLDIELGIYLITEVRPGEPVQSGYELLSGYPLLEAIEPFRVSVGGCV